MSKRRRIYGGKSNIMKKIFNKSGSFKLNEEGWYSVSFWNDAQRVSDKLLEHFGNDIIITDATAGFGGNSCNFANNFKHVNAIEKNPENFKLLKHNLKICAVDNVSFYNSSALDIIKEIDQDIVFFDPPWGGKDYKKYNKLMLYLDERPIWDVINEFKEKLKAIVLKAPNNFDIEITIEKTGIAVETLKLDRYNVHFFYLD